MGKAGLQKAFNNKNDEFYTLYEDIEKEMEHYKDYFRMKTIFLPCDTEDSGFWEYFRDNFDSLGLKQVYALHLEEPRSCVVGIDKTGLYKKLAKDNGDFFGETAQTLLKECDIVITNPSFTLVKDFVTTILSADKEFILLAPETAAASRQLFPLL